MLNAPQPQAAPKMAPTQAPVAKPSVTPAPQAQAAQPQAQPSAQGAQSQRPTANGQYDPTIMDNLKAHLDSLPPQQKEFIAH